MKKKMEGLAFSTEIPKAWVERKKRAKKRARRSLIAGLSLCIALAIVGVATFNLFSERSKPYTYYAGSTYIYQGDSREDMGAAAVLRDGCILAPAKALGSSLGLTVEWLATENAVTMKSDAVEMNFSMDKNRALINGVLTETAYPAFILEGCAFVPVDTVYAALGYSSEYTDRDMRLDLYDAKEENAQPVAKFSVDKDTYQEGEKVEFTLSCQDADGDEIVDFAWENRKDRYFSAGDQTISLRVKDCRGAWSEPYELVISITGPEYQGANKIAVLMYHYLAPAADCAEGGRHYGNGGVLSVEKFREQMKWIHDNGYNAIFISDLMTYLKEGELPPEKSVVITFDDGYENNYTEGFPILQEYGVKANLSPVMISSVRKSDDPDWDDSRQPRLTFDEMEEMMDSGLLEVGSHSYDGHGTLASENGVGYFFVNKKYNQTQDSTETESEYLTRINDDLILSRQVLRERLGIEGAVHFVYPYGRYTSALQQDVENLGFTCAFAIKNRYVTTSDDFYALPRISVSQGIVMEDFVAILEGKYGIEN